MIPLPRFKIVFSSLPLKEDISFEIIRSNILILFGGTFVCRNKIEHRIFTKND